jgi:hypothetical protein
MTVPLAIDRIPLRAAVFAATVVVTLCGAAGADEAATPQLTLPGMSGAVSAGEAVSKPAAKEKSRAPYRKLVFMNNCSSGVCSSDVIKVKNKQRLEVAFLACTIQGTPPITPLTISLDVRAGNDLVAAAGFMAGDTKSFQGTDFYVFSEAVQLGVEAGEVLSASSTYDTGNPVAGVCTIVGELVKFK